MLEIPNQYYDIFSIINTGLIAILVFVIIGAVVVTYRDMRTECTHDGSIDYLKDREAKTSKELKELRERIEKMEKEQQNESKN